jgi:hypothetical protein
MRGTGRRCYSPPAAESIEQNSFVQFWLMLAFYSSSFLPPSFG